MLTIRPARPGDEAVVSDLIRELAAYEKLAHEAVATPEREARNRRRFIQAGTHDGAVG